MFLIIQGTSDFHLLWLFSHVQACVPVPHADTAGREHTVSTRTTCCFVPSTPCSMVWGLGAPAYLLDHRSPFFCLLCPPPPLLSLSFVSPTSTIPPQKVPTLSQQFLHCQCTTEPREAFHQYFLWSLKVFFGLSSTISGNGWIMLWFDYASQMSTILIFVVGMYKGNSTRGKNMSYFKLKKKAHRPIWHFWLSAPILFH